MKLFYRALSICFAILIAVLLIGAGRGGAGEQRPSEPTRKLVARYDPLQLKIWVDSTSASSPPQFIIEQGHDPIYMREVDSNKITITHLEKGMSVLSTEYDEKGNVIRRTVNINSARDIKYTYDDTNGDGLFDYFLSYRVPGEFPPTVYVRSNLTWVPRSVPK